MTCALVLLSSMMGCQGMLSMLQGLHARLFRLLRTENLVLVLQLRNGMPDLSRSSRYFFSLEAPSPRHCCRPAATCLSASLQVAFRVGPLHRRQYALNES